MFKNSKFIFFFIIFGVSSSLLASDIPFDFDDALKQAQYEAIIEEVRCLVCQNQSLSDSSAGLAQDLRNEIYEMVIAGKSDDEILEFLVARYGDFVLYRPPLKATTWLLWFGPFIFILVSAIIIVRFIKGRSALSDEVLNDEELEKLKVLLNSKEREES